MRSSGPADLVGHVRDRLSARLASMAGAALVSLSAVGLPGTAGAALSYEGWGPRAGFSGSPDQVVIGMHVRLSELAEHLRLEPNADIGFGDDLTVFTLNPDLTYSVPLENAGSLYFGGAISLVFARVDVKGASDSDADLGIAAIAGYRLPVAKEAWGIDLKLGLSDEYPDVKLMGTYTFPH